MKFCPRCNTEKQKSEFGARKLSKDGLQCYCKICRKDIDRASYLASESRRDSIKGRRDIITSYNRRLTTRYKRFKGCKVCYEKEPVVLDLHHTDPTVKEGNPSYLCCCSTETLKKEIRKCIVLCSNCHRKVHAGILQV